MKVQTKSKKVNKAWLNDHIHDPYVRLAQKEGFRSRAAYKLKEIDEQLSLVKPGNVVVDLGCAPGAWCQYLRRRMSPTGAASGTLNGSIIGLDILPMEPVEDVTFIQGDFREEEVLAQLRMRKREQFEQLGDVRIGHRCKEIDVAATGCGGVQTCERAFPDHTIT